MAHVNSGSFRDEKGKIYLWQTDKEGKPITLQRSFQYRENVCRPRVYLVLLKIPITPPLNFSSVKFLTRIIIHPLPYLSYLVNAKDNHQSMV